MRAGSASVMLEGIAGSGEAARQAGGTGRCALLTGSVAAPAARLLVRSEVLALKSAHSGGCVRAVLFRGGAQNSARRTRRAVGLPEESSSPPLEHCTSAGQAVARASLRAEARRVGATTVAAPLRSSLKLALVVRPHSVPPSSKSQTQAIAVRSVASLPSPFRWFLLIRSPTSISARPLLPLHLALLRFRRLRRFGPLRG